jgi:hypothetical protein
MEVIIFGVSKLGDNGAGEKRKAVAMHGIATALSAR